MNAPFAPPAAPALIETVIYWTDFRGREHDADCTASWELRNGRPFITGWTLETDRYVPDEVVEDQVYQAIDDDAWPAESYVPAIGFGMEARHGG